MIKKNKLNFLLDGCAGSSGKGKMAAFLVKNNKIDYLVTSNTANASHTVVEKGKEYVFKVLPSGVLYHEKIEKVFIADGAGFVVADLFKEIEMTGIPLEKIFISPRAAIITQIDKDYENGLCDLQGEYFETRQDGTLRTGTTASGSGAVLAKKVLRIKNLVTAGDLEELKPFITDVGTEIMKINGKKTGLFEIGQGYPLSNNHPMFAPFTTSRNVTVAAALNDAMLSPSIVGNVFINFRTFPIKIHNYKYLATEDKEYSYPASSAAWVEKNHCPHHTIVSDGVTITVNIFKDTFLSYYEKDFVLNERIDSHSGEFYPDQEEITWEELNSRIGDPEPPILECTTLTKLPRRVAEFSKENLIDAVVHNVSPFDTFVSVNFANYVDPVLEDCHGSYKWSNSTKFNDWLVENIVKVQMTLLKDYDILFGIALIGTGAETDSTITVDEYSTTNNTITG